jgi:hypothetical protein
VIGGVADAGVRSNESKEHGGQMPDTAKVVTNLATGLEDAERATVAFRVGGAAVEQGK